MNLFVGYLYDICDDIDSFDICVAKNEKEAIEYFRKFNPDYTLKRIRKLSKINDINYEPYLINLTKMED